MPPGSLDHRKERNTLLKFICKKVLQMIPMLLIISFLIFAGLQMTGIDPVNYLIPRRWPAIPPLWRRCARAWD